MARSRSRDSQFPFLLLLPLLVAPIWLMIAYSNSIELFLENNAYYIIGVLIGTLIIGTAIFVAIIRWNHIRKMIYRKKGDM
jgi:uncharacterized membrane protein